MDDLESEEIIQNEGLRHKYIWGKDDGEKSPEMIPSNVPKPPPYDGYYEIIDKAIAYAKRKAPKIKEGTFNRWRDYSEEERRDKNKRKSHKRKRKPSLELEAKDDLDTDSLNDMVQHDQILSQNTS